MMRTRALLVTALLFIPVVTDAQIRLPRIGGRGPARPAPMPPQAPTIAREMAYKRLNIAFESYPLVSRFDAPGFNGNGISSSWTSFGMGTRADYRLTALLSATFDVTSSFLGGPAFVQTAELGTRLRAPRSSERTIYPFLDVRGGFTYAIHNQFSSYGGLNAFPVTNPTYNSQYSQGFGAMAGGGVEFALTRTLSMTSAVTAARSRMSIHGFTQNRPVDGTYYMTSYRYTIGLRYNPVRMIALPGIGER
jgi:hypothetical protein